MTVRETIQNRATNQSAAWALLALMFGPLAAQFQLYIPPPLESIIYTLGMAGLFLLFIRSDKQQEHDKAATLITEPKYLEQFLDRYKRISEGFGDAITKAMTGLKAEGETEKTISETKEIMKV